jgi:predicted Rossmann fold nucleotide-binding protein DprA/Smf involved in DNA uptake
LKVVRVVSGGQTGADRAALDWAIARGIAHGGWCPRGRRAEDGPIAARYRLKETPSRDYQQRTRWNVRDSDGTLIVTRAKVLTGGSAYTARVAARLGQPCLHVHPGADDPAAIREFLERHRIRTLNVAGPRASSDAEVYQYALGVLERLAQVEHA